MKHAKESQAAWRKRNPGYFRRWALWNNYGLTLERYEAMLKRQGGCCAICRRQVRGSFHVDHKKKVVRGLLCSLCNQGLGLFKDDPKRLLAAVRYLRRTSK